MAGSGIHPPSQKEGGATMLEHSNARRPSLFFKPTFCPMPPKRYNTTRKATIFQASESPTFFVGVSRAELVFYKASCEAR